MVVLAIVRCASRGRTEFLARTTVCGPGIPERDDRGAWVPRTLCGLGLQTNLLLHFGIVQPGLRHVGRFEGQGRRRRMFDERLSYSSLRPPPATPPHFIYISLLSTCPTPVSLSSHIGLLVHHGQRACRGKARVDPRPCSSAPLSLKSSPHCCTSSPPLYLHLAISAPWWFCPEQCQCRHHAAGHAR